MSSCSNNDWNVTLYGLGVFIIEESILDVSVMILRANPFARSRPYLKSELHDGGRSRSRTVAAVWVVLMETRESQLPSRACFTYCSRVTPGFFYIRFCIKALGDPALHSCNQSNDSDRRIYQNEILLERLKSQWWYNDQSSRSEVCPLNKPDQSTLTSERVRPGTA